MSGATPAMPTPPTNPASLRTAGSAGHARRLAAAATIVAALIALTPAAAQESAVTARAREIESWLQSNPQRAADELLALLAHADRNRPEELRYLVGLEGQALIQAGRIAEARELANRQDADATARRDPLLAAEAMLIVSGVQWRTGDAATANELALKARAALRDSGDLFLEHWATLAAGIASRARGQFEAALDNLHASLAAAERAHDPNRRAAARYQLSVLTLALKQPRTALEESQEAFRQAVLGRNAYLMAKAKMAESAAFEALQQPIDELAALEDALSIARTTGSQTAEGLALVNLADVYLRRKDFKVAHDLARAALESARAFNDVSLMATAKANMGFALLGQGRTDAGKRLAEDALSDYERAGATAEIASLLGEYAGYLESAGDYKAALAMFHRERRLNEEISLAAHDKAVLELQGRYESERRRLEIERLNRENTLKSAELKQRELTERMSWLLAVAFAALSIVVVVLYRKLQVTNRLLAERNRDLQSQSTIDPLTTLYNRRHFQDFIRTEPNAGERRRRGGGTDVQAILLIDLDHFKTINDRYGHAAGDAVLVEMSQRLRDTLRDEDMIVRWGGEEFLVFVPAVAIGRLDDIAMRLMNRISAEPVMFHGTAIRATASIGYAPMPLPPHNLALSWERALGLIDMALYMAKLHGRNRAYGVKALFRDDAEALTQVERDLEAAWREGIVEIQVLINGPRPPLAPAEMPSNLDLAA